MNVNYKRIGQEIKHARLDARMTQEVLAEKTDLSVTHISAIETATTGISLSTLVKIAEELNLSIDAMLFGNHDSEMTVEREINAILRDCSEREKYILLALLRTNKDTLRNEI